MKREERYTQFCLVQEMMETVGIIRDFSVGNIEGAVSAITDIGVDAIGFNCGKAGRTGHSPCQPAQKGKYIQLK